MTTLLDKPLIAADFEDCSTEEMRYTAHYAEHEVVKDNGLFVRGFASTNTKDRHGQQINPALFSLHTFRQNPQVWVNHKLWMDEYGNGHAVGSATEIHAVKVANYNQQTRKMDLLDLDTGAVIRSGVSTDKMLVANGMKGLWIVCHVTNPSVVEDVNNGLLNAFSWSGTAYARPDGRHAAYDLHEVSLVNLPANATALFQIGKSLYTEHLDEMTNVIVSTSIDLAAISALLKGNASEYTQNVETKNTTTKGGDSMDGKEKEEGAQSDVLKAVGDLATLVKGVGENIKALDGRLSNVEAAFKKKPDPMDGMDEENKKKKEADEAALKKSQEDAAAKDKSGNEEVLKELKSLSTTATEALSLVKAQAAKIEALEKQTATSKGAADDDTDEAAEEEAILKSLATMTKEERKIADRKLVAQQLISNGAARRIHS